MKRQHLSNVHQIMIGFGIAAVFVLAVEAFQSGHPGWRIESQNEDGSYSISMRDGRDRLTVRSRGKVEFEDDRRVARLEAGARLRIEERLEGTKHRLVVTPNADGSPDYAYRVDGQVRDFDEQAEQWLAGVLLRIFRSTGIDADRRVQEILAEAGVDGVLEEVSFISSDSVAATYLGELLKLTEGSSELSSDDLSRILSRAQDQMDSDYHLSKLLEAVPANRLEEPGVLESFVAAAGVLDSDYHLRQLLASVIDTLYEDQQPSTSTLDALLGVARQIESDHESLQLVTRVAEFHQPELELPSNLMHLLRSIESDYSLHRAISAFLVPQASSENRRVLYAIAKNIESDHELSELLKNVAAQAQPGQTFETEIFELLEAIESDHALATAAERLGVTMDPSQVPDLLDAAEIDSDFQAGALLVSLIENHGAAVASSPSFDRFRDGIDSSYELERVQDALAIAESQPARASTPPVADPAATDPETADPKATDSIEAEAAEPGAADPEHAEPEASEPTAVDFQDEDSQDEDSQDKPSGR